jgi:hypothetical protein
MIMHRVFKAASKSDARTSWRMITADHPACCGRIVAPIGQEGRADIDRGDGEEPMLRGAGSAARRGWTKRRQMRRLMTSDVGRNRRPGITTLLLIKDRTNAPLD